MGIFFLLPSNNDAHIHFFQFLCSRSKQDCLQDTISAMGIRHQHHARWKCSLVEQVFVFLFLSFLSVFLPMPHLEANFALFNSACFCCKCQLELLEIFRLLGLAKISPVVK
ncbi:hypothetical protein ACH5RR_019249 [Cinchona calisaya]|uniref:Uncharacterized protein n=1 Tax=Cinchona calisaya TaxID=153742 RepID=A0ABD2ZSG7_9GENT